MKARRGWRWWWVGMLAGCGAAVSPVPEYPPGGLASADPTTVRTLGLVHGEACRAWAFSPLPTEEEARMVVRREAAALGASGVIAVRCHRAGVWDGCSLGVVCDGTAFRVEPSEWVGARR